LNRQDAKSGKGEEKRREEGEGRIEI